MWGIPLPNPNELDRTPTAMVTGRTIIKLCLFALTTDLAVAQDFQWEQRANMPAGRWGASTFVINGLAYVVAGRSGSTDHTEMWAYSAGTDSWSAKAPIPVGRRLATVFAMNGKGYVGCGLTSSSTRLSDLWEYDPITDEWTQRADFPGQARYGTWHFAINGLAYVGSGNMGTGSGPFLDDAYIYDPTTDTWTNGFPIPDLARHGTSSFVINGKGYVVGGREQSLAFVPDVWRFDPQTNSWSSLADFPGTPRSSPLAFVYYNDAVVGCGRDGSENYYDVWSYTPSLDQWGAVPDYPGMSSLAGTSFSIGNRAFGGLGWVLSDNSSHFDLWELVKPTNTGTSEEQSTLPVVRLYPVPADPGDGLLITTLMTGPINAELINSLGQNVMSWTFVSTYTMATEGLAPGPYVIRWQQGGMSGQLRCVIR